MPALRVHPEVRDAVESLLETGETLSNFVEQVVLERLERRRYQSEFIARAKPYRSRNTPRDLYIPPTDHATAFPLEATFTTINNPGLPHIAARQRPEFLQGIGPV